MAVILENIGFSSLGFIQLAIFYLFQMIGSFIAPAIQAKIGLKKALFVGGFMMSFVTLSMISPSYYDQNKLSDSNNIFMKGYVIEIILYISNIFGGIGSALIWVA